MTSTLSLNIQILTSLSSDQELSISILNYLSESHHFPKISFLQSTETLELIDGSNFDLIIDLTSSLLLRKSILEYSQSNEVPVIYLDPNTFIQDHWAFCAHSKLNLQASSLISLVQRLGWYRVALISQNEDSSINLSSVYQSIASHAFHAYVSLDISNEKLKDLISKKLKPGGYKQFIVFGQGEFVDRIATSMQSNYMYHYSGIISGSNGIWSNYNEKSVVVVEAGLEAAASRVHYELLAIGKIISSIEELNDIEKIGSRIRDHLEATTTDHMKNPVFSIINKQNLVKVQVGKVENGQLSLTGNLTFTMGIPDNSPVLIYSSLSMNNPPGLPAATYVPYMQTGAMIAYQMVSQSQSKLTNHLLSPFSASCGSEFFNEYLSVSCWSQSYKALGSFYLTSPLYSVTAGESPVFQNLGLKVPMIGGYDTTADLSNSTKFPYFTRIVGSIDATAYLVNVFAAMNWEKFSIIYTNTTIFEKVHQNILNLGVKIVNAEDLRVLPAGYNDSMFDQHQDVFWEVDRTKIRTIFLISMIDEAFHIAKGFKRIGLRTGDLIPFFSFLVSSSVNVQTDESLKQAFIEIFEFGIVVSGLEFVGEYGLGVKEKIKQTIGERVENTCYSFDAMMLGINAVDYLLTTGLLYENPDLLLKSIRNQRFQGCSGIISIDPDSNDRRNYIFGMFQLVYNNETQSYEDRLIAIIDKDEVAPVVKVDNYTWSSGSSSTPANSRLDGLSCPFEDREIRDASTSKSLLYFFASFFLFYTIFVSIIIWLKWWKKEIKMIDQPVPEKFGDFIVMGVILIDSLQTIGMGPDLVPLIFGAETLPDAISLNLSNIINFSKDVYWMGLYITLIVVLTWFLFAIIIIGRLGESYNFKLFKVANKLGINFIPVVADVLFLPVISICLFIFDCDKSIGNDLTDSYMNKDCYTFCWKGSHLTYVILASLALSVYIPICVFLRPLWQELEPDVNIHTSTVTYIGKATCQIAIVVLNRTVKKSHESLLGLSMIGVYFLFTIILLKFKPFNYARANMWKLISHIAICWILLWASVYWYSRVMPYLWTTIIVIGWAGLAVFGILYQKRHYPSLLISEKQLDISALVKFTFSKSVKLGDHTIKRMSTLNFIQGGKYEIKDDESSSPAKRSNAVFAFDGRVGLDADG